MKLYYKAIGFFRGIKVSLMELGKGDEIIEINNGNYPHPFYIRLGVPGILVYNQVIIKEDCDIKVAGDVCTIIDAGSNIGVVAIFFAKRYPGGA